MLNAIKKSLRITHNVLDDDINSTISAALLDMSRVGICAKNISVDEPSSYDSLELKCVELYCKWNFDYQGKADLWFKAYENLRNAMSLCGDYNGGNVHE